MARICEDVAALHRAGVDVVVVTSGAIARGMHLLRMRQRPSGIEDLQAASAVGQGRLYRTYDELLRERDIQTAQVLLTFFDMSARTHYLNARRTLQALLAWRIVPVINENDTTTTDEISFGDNDFLAAQVAVLLTARLLVLLTDTPGVFTADPRRDPSASLIGEVTDFEALRAASSIGAASSALGSGGMRSKIVAAEMATAAGTETVIGSGFEPGVLARAAAGEPAGTVFPRRRLALVDSATKDAALHAIADALVARTPEVLEANERDLEAGREAGLSAALMDRLALDEARVAAMAAGVRDIVALPDPVGEVIDGFRLPN